MPEHQRQQLEPRAGSKAGTRPGATPLLTLLVGIPGSGKSTHARAAATADPHLSISSRDVLRRRLYRDRYTAGDPAREAEVTLHQVDEVTAALSVGRDVMIDDTNLEPDVVDSWRSLAAELGCRFEVVRLDVALEVALARNAARTGRARVPDQVIRRMHRRLADGL